MSFLLLSCILESNAFVFLKYKIMHLKFIISNIEILFRVESSRVSALTTVINQRLKPASAASRDLSAYEINIPDTENVNDSIGNVSAMSMRPVLSGTITAPMRVSNMQRPPCTLLPSLANFRKNNGEWNKLLPSRQSGDVNTSVLPYSCKQVLETLPACMVFMHGLPGLSSNIPTIALSEGSLAISAHSLISVCSCRFFNSFLARAEGFPRGNVSTK